MEKIIRFFSLRRRLVSKKAGIWKFFVLNKPIKQILKSIFKLTVCMVQCNSLSFINSKALLKTHAVFAGTLLRLPPKDPLSAKSSRVSCASTSGPYWVDKNLRNPNEKLAFTKFWVKNIRNRVKIQWSCSIFKNK